MFSKIEETGIRITKRLERSKLLFIHVPKTAGTTLVNILKQSNYVLHKDKGHPVSDVNNYDIIFGHFRPDKYDNEIPKVLFLRNPVERMLSHYTHWKSRLENENKNMIMCYPEKTASFPKDCSFTEFAESVGNIYKKYTDYNLKQFSFVGFTEFFDLYLNRMDTFFNLGIDYTYVDRRVNFFKRRLMQEESVKISSIIKEDLKFYYEALSDRLVL